MLDLNNILDFDTVNALDLDWILI